MDNDIDNNQNADRRVAYGNASRWVYYKIIFLELCKFLKVIIDNNNTTVSKFQLSSTFEDGYEEFNGNKLRSIQEVPKPFQDIFADFRVFNVLQSEVFNDVFYTGE